AGPGPGGRSGAAATGAGAAARGELRGPIRRRADAARARGSAQQRGIPGQPASQAGDRGFFRCPRQDSNLRPSAPEVDSAGSNMAYTCSPGGSYLLKCHTQLVVPNQSQSNPAARTMSTSN